MPSHVIIDGNNLLYAMHEHAPIPSVGRETMVRVIDRWARSHSDDVTGGDDVTLVFDGPTPRGGMSKQMASSRIGVRFSAPKTADDVIIDMVNRAKDPGSIRIVTGDRAIQHAAKMRRCRVTESHAFVAELFADPNSASKNTEGSDAEKPPSVTPDEAAEWLKTFGLEATGEPSEDVDVQDGW